MTDWTRDVLHACRLIRKQPAFAATAIGVLALAIGANLTLFALVDGLLLRPLTAAEPERLVSVFSRDTTRADAYRGFSYETFEQIRANRAVFADVLSHNAALVGLTEGEMTRRVFADVVSASYFPTLGVALAAGRPFTEMEARPGADAAVVVISDALYNRLGRPADVLSRTLRINRRDFTIVGVAPPQFSGTTALASPELWLPLSVWDRVVNDFMREEVQPGGLMNPEARPLFLVGRLRPGVTQSAADASLAVLAERQAQASPATYAHQQLFVRPMSRAAISTRPPNDGGLRAAGGLLVAVGFTVVLIACLNVANLLLARSLGRRREIGVRRALGASRWQVVRQLLLEGAVLAIPASVLGLGIATVAARYLVSTIQAIAPVVIVFTVSPDFRVLAATVTAGIAATLMCALGPAWKVTRTDITSDLQVRPAEIRLTGGWRRRLSASNVLVVGQIALSLVLLSTAGLFMRGATKATTMDPGFALDRELIATIDPALAGYDADRAQEVIRSALDRVRQVPGVESASVASTTPYGDVREDAALAASATVSRDEFLACQSIAIGRDYFRTLDMPMVRGRDFNEAEERGTANLRVAIVDRTTADKLWPGRDPIGQTLYRSKSRQEQLEALTVVGVTTPRYEDLLEGSAEPHVYLPLAQERRSLVTLHIKTAAGPGEEMALLPAVRDVLRQVDANVPILKLATLRDHRNSSAGMWMVVTSGRIFGAVGLLAAVLAVSGLYAVVSYLVSRRVHEIGIRIALGARTRDVMALVAGDGARVAAAGVGIGILLSAAAVAVIRSIASTVAVADPVVIVGAPALLASAAVLACLLPARRASRLPPLAALRDE